jgi:hypothetical protein
MRADNRIKRLLRTAATAAALLSLGTVFAQQASAGCGRYQSLQPAAFSWQSSDSLFGTARLMKTGLVTVADTETASTAWMDQKPAITGLWHFQYIAEGNTFPKAPPDGVKVDGGYTTWYADGNELTSSEVRAPTTGSICVGIWIQTGPLSYELNHVGLSWDPVANVAAGPAFIKQFVTLRPDLNHYSGKFTIRQFKADGKTLDVEIKGNIVAERVDIDTE